MVFCEVVPSSIERKRTGGSETSAFLLGSLRWLIVHSQGIHEGHNLQTIPFDARL